jgi:hypothetical protein
MDDSLGLARAIFSSPGGAFLKSPDAFFPELGWRPLISRWVGVKVGRVRLFVVRSHGIDTPRNCIKIA